MADIFSKRKRSEIMGLVKGKNNKPELLVRKFLHANGYRFRLHVKELPGKPDIVLPKYKTVIMVHGCFWHQHKNCSKSSLPKTNATWWKEKLLRNVTLDEKAEQALVIKGWKVLTVWQCELSAKTIEQALQRLLKQLQKGD
jgi:DNA mismatch endonuclease, patch repair protein